MVCKGAAPPCNPTNYLLFLAFGWGETGCVYCVVCEILCGLDLLPVYHRLRTFVPAGSLPRLKLRTDATPFSLLWSFLRKLLRRPLTATNKSKTEPFWLCFTHGLRFFRSCGVFFENSFILDYAAFGTMQLGFIIFYKIISLRSVPHNQARPTANPPSPINCYKQIQN